MHPLTALVADSATARLIEYRADGTPHLVKVLTNTAARASEQSLVSSRPGRVVNRALGHTQSFDPHETKKKTALERFAVAIADELGTRTAAAPQAGLLLIAGGRLLGLIKSHLPLPSKRCVVGTIPKDLSHLTLPELGPLLRPFGASPPPGPAPSGRRTLKPRKRASDVAV
jgi:protein required for attachment to host cells